jgi:acyl-CoA oxidase
MSTTSEHLQRALDGRWRDTKTMIREKMSLEIFRPHFTPTKEVARARVNAQLKIIAAAGQAEDSFQKERGGTGDAGAAVTKIAMLAMSDLSLMVKAGVLWGLFGGAVENLGTERHHEAYVRPLITLDLLGCFAMTETGHGSDVQALETTATYDPATEEFVINSPTPTSRKDYIGGAAESATVAAVFAQLITNGENHGVHCLVVPIRDESGNGLPGVRTWDCDYKGGLPGVDNGRIMFDHVRVPRENLLNRFADVAPDGTYSSEIENANRRFFTMLGTLVRGRVTVGGSVNKSGIFPISGKTTLMQAIAMAGGLGKFAVESDVKIIRNQQDGSRQVLTYDLKPIRKVEAEDPLVLTSDVIVVANSEVREKVRSKEEEVVTCLVH